jgi:putative flippase GtrA
LKKEKVVEFLRFSINGGIGTFSGYIVLIALTEYFKLWYLISSVLGELVNFFLSFLIHKFFTFNNGEKEKTKQELLSYSMLSLKYSVLGTVSLYLMTDWCGIIYAVSKIVVLLILAYPYYWETERIFPKKPDRT